jgi:bromodomain-containing factor 1
LYPVDPIALNIPDYPKIVKHPMDMSTIYSRIDMHHYSSVNDIYADFKLMLNNCFIYNPPGTPVHEVGRQVEKLWTEKLQSNPVLNARPPVIDNEDVEFANVDVDYEIRTLEKQMADMQTRLNRLRAYRTKNTEKARAKATAAANHAKTSKVTTSNAHASSSKAAKPKASAGASKPAAASKPRKQSTSGAAANGKKASAPTYHEVVYDDESDVEEPPAPVSLAQKQELADKIAEVDSDTLNQALEIISKTTAVGEVSHPYSYALSCAVTDQDTLYREMTKLSSILMRYHPTPSSSYTTLSSLATRMEKYQRRRTANGRALVPR